MACSEVELKSHSVTLLYFDEKMNDAAIAQRQWEAANQVQAMTGLESTASTATATATTATTTASATTTTTVTATNMMDQDSVFTYDAQEQRQQLDDKPWSKEYVRAIERARVVVLVVGGWRSNPSLLTATITLTTATFTSPLIPPPRTLYSPNYYKKVRVSAVALMKMVG